MCPAPGEPPLLRKEIAESRRGRSEGWWSRGGRNGNGSRWRVSLRTDLEANPRSEQAGDDARPRRDESALEGGKPGEVNRQARGGISFDKNAAGSDHLEFGCRQFRFSTSTAAGQRREWQRLRFSQFRVQSVATPARRHLEVAPTARFRRLAGRFRRRREAANSQGHA